MAFQIAVSRTGHRDVLTVRLDTKGTEIDRATLQTQFEKLFQEVCTVKIDTVEFLEPGSLKDDAKLIIDDRAWK
jgi:phenylacetate-CoA ligase